MLDGAAVLHVAFHEDQSAAVERLDVTVVVRQLVSVVGLHGFEAFNLIKKHIFY